MKVYKYCRPEHNPLKGNQNIRMGSTKYFRKNYKGESDLINDWSEGMSLSIDSHNNRLVKPISPDAFIFCTSTQKTQVEKVVEPYDASYQSCYCIKDIKAFATELSRHAMNYFQNNLKIENFPSKTITLIEEYMSRQNIDFNIFKEELRLSINHGIVYYVKGQLNAPTEDEMGTLEWKFWVATYFKLEKYQEQSEYRFSITIYHQPTDITFEVINDYILVDFENILDFVESC